MSHTFAVLTSHIIFSTKDRIACIDPGTQARLFPYIGGIVREAGGRVSIVNGAMDHVHILAALPPALNVSDLVRVVKANSSKWMHETIRKGTFAWQTGYGAFSVSHSSVDSVTKYIAEQAEHHKRRSFQAEFLALLKKHGVEYDERYIWG